MKQSKPRVPVGGSSAPLKQSLSGLAALRDKLPSGPVNATPAITPPTAHPAPNQVTYEDVVRRAQKLVVRRERKGHGGKTVTRIESLNGSAEELDSVARALKRALGCGAVVDGADVLVQGDQAERVTTFLQNCGAKKVVQGN